MDDAQVVGVIHPDTSEKAYCSIMGRESEFKAIAVYPGRQGWWSYLQLSNEDVTLDPNELMYKQRCLVVSYETQAAADADDLALLKHCGIVPEPGQLIPSFRSYLPGFVPSPPDLEEFDWLRTAVPQALAASWEVQAGIHAMPETGLNKQGQLLFRQHASGAWASAWLKPDANADFSPPQIQLAATLAQAGRALPQTQGIWLMEEFFIPEPADDADGGRPFFPRALVFFDMEVQEFKGLCLLHPDNWPDGVGESLIEMLLNQGARPAQLVVSKRDNFILTKPFCQALGIGINLELGLDIIPDLREAVLEMWRAEA